MWNCLIVKVSVLLLIKVLIDHEDIYDNLDDSLFVAQIVRTANEMSSTDNATPTNKSYKD